jgi:tellurite methyltransferase
MNFQELNNELGNIDLYLLDHILKGRFEPNMKILDAGSGEGRNLAYFIKNNFEVYAIDKNPGAIKMLQFIGRSINPFFDKDNCTIGDLNELPYPDNSFDAVLNCAVLHFAQNHDEFQKQLSETVRVTKAGGLIFIRMASNIGMEEESLPDEKGRCLLPDGSWRYLLTKNILKLIPIHFNVHFEEPVKTVLVNDQRCMSNLLLRKI